MEISNVMDIGNIPLDEDVAIDYDDYVRIMRSIGSEGKPQVSAFNSSI
jgi:hypothetical protein